MNTAKAWWSGAAAIVVALIPGLAFAATAGASYVRVAHGSKIAHVEIIGTLFNGSTELMQAGSGVRVSQAYVLTSGHLFSKETNYKSIQINVRLGSREGNPLRATLELKDDSLDLALLRLQSFSTEIACPYFLVTDTRAVPAGSELYFLGFPIDGPLRISPGIMSIDPDPSIPFWETNAPINPGDSGAPAFTQYGYLAGIAKGVLSDWRTGKQIVPLAGITRFVPATRIQASEIGNRILVENADLRCLRAVPMKPDGSFSFAGSRVVPLEAPAEFSIAHAVVAEWNPAIDGPSQRRVFEATPGYAIKRCTFEAIKVVSTTISCLISAAGDSVVVELTPPAQSMPPVSFVAGRLVLDQRPSTQ